MRVVAAEFRRGRCAQRLATGVTNLVNLGVIATLEGAAVARSGQGDAVFGHDALP